MGTVSVRSRSVRHATAVQRNRYREKATGPMTEKTSDWVMVGIGLVWMVWATLLLVYGN